MGTTNSKPTGSIAVTDRPIRNAEDESDHIYYTLFYKCTGLLGLVRAMANCAIMLTQHHFGVLKTAIL
jgi:hypothetical protein